MKPAIQNSVFDQIKSILLGKRANKNIVLSAFSAFVLGALARAIATIFVFPVTRAKVLMMKSQGKVGSDESAVGNLVNTILSTLKSEGITAIYRVSLCSKNGINMKFANFQQSNYFLDLQGLWPELQRGVLSAALMLMVKEKLFLGVKRCILHL